MRKPHLKKIAALFSSLVLLLSLITSTFAQTAAELTEMRSKFDTLISELRYVDAVHLGETLVKATPNDGQLHVDFGFCLIALSNQNKNSPASKAAVIRARDEFITAKRLGVKTPLVDAMIDSLPKDGVYKSSFSAIAAAESLMNDAEASFSQGKLDDALAKYQKALELDPTIYEAALFSGDAYKSKNDAANAEKWYQKAIALNPNRETAYRYSATPLMQRGRTDEALARYVEAYIVEPYSKFAISGLVQWGTITRTKLAHPTLNIPKSAVGADGKPTTVINVNPLADDGSMAWIGYTATREVWKKEKFAKTFPGQTYRHTLAEEADALRSVISFLDAAKQKPKQLAPDLETLIKLDKDGVLEAYILLAIPDQGVAEDHAEYLAKNRDKLRRYVLNYVVQK